MSGSLVAASIPPDRHYTRDHMWVRVEGSLARLGITSLAQDALGDVVFVDVPAVGLELKVGEAFSWIESDKVVTDLFPPLPGRVAQTNEVLASAPETINRDPYGAGWICMVEPNQEGQLSTLLDSRGYAAILEEKG